MDRNYRVPLSVNIRLTHKCANRCVYCDYDRNKPDALTTKVLDNIFGEIWKLGGRRLNFTGGEPLLRDDFNEIVKLAKNRGFFLSIATSGTIAEKRLDGLKMCDRVMLSFDGPHEVRAALCGERAAEESENAVRLFVEHGIPFWTTSVLARPVMPHVDWLIEHAEKNGSQANFVMMYIGESGGFRTHPVESDDIKNLTPSAEDYRNVLDRIIALKKNGAPVGSSMPYLKECREWHEHPACRSVKQSRRYGKCIAVRASCELMADGRLYSCDWAFADTPGVSALDNGFTTAFKALPIQTACQSCVLSCKLEANLLFCLNPAAVFNWARKI